MLKFFLLTFLILSPLGIGTCWAAHPLITDDAGTMGKGNTELEVSVEYERLRDHGSKEKKFIFGSTFTHGFIETADIVFSVPYLFVRARESGETERERGFGDTVAEVKWRWHEKNGLGLALKPGLILPTGQERRGLGTGKVGYQLLLVATKELKPIVIHGNAGYLRNENKVDERKDLWHLSMAGEVPLSERLILVADIGTDTDPARSRDRQQNFALGGLIWAVSDSVWLDSGLKYSFTSGGEGWSVLTGLTVQF
jgi:hypothetical protein